MKPIYRWLILGLILLVGGWLLRDRVSDLGALSDVPVSVLAQMVVLVVISRFMTGVGFHAALQTLGHKTSLLHMFWLNILGSYSALVVPRSGHGARAAYLKLRHGIPLAESSAILLPLFVVQAVVAGVTGLAAIGIWAVVAGGAIDKPIAWSLAAVAAFGFGAMFVRFASTSQPRGRVGRFFRELNESWKTLQGHFFLIAGLTILHVAILAVDSARLHLAFGAVGAEVSYVQALAVGAIAQVSIIVSLTPAGLGLREGVISYSGKWLGVGVGPALSASILDRLVTVSTILVLTPVAYWRLSRSEST